MTNIINRLKHNCDYEAYCALANLNPEERVQKLKDFFLVACKGSVSEKGDKKAKEYSDWLMHAMIDLNFPDGEPKEDAILKGFRAKEAMMMYSFIPNYASASFLETRESLLTLALVWCYRTEDEKESDSIFKFFISRPSPDSGAGEEKTLILKILRKSTEFPMHSMAPVERFARHFLMLHLGGSPQYDFKDEIGRVLLNAWIRYEDIGKISQVFYTASLP